MAAESQGTDAPLTCFTNRKWRPSILLFIDLFLKNVTFLISRMKIFPVEHFPKPPVRLKLNHNTHSTPFFSPTRFPVSNARLREWIRKSPDVPLTYLLVCECVEFTNVFWTLCLVLVCECALALLLVYFTLFLPSITFFCVKNKTYF